MFVLNYYNTVIKCELYNTVQPIQDQNIAIYFLAYPYIIFDANLRIL